MLVIAVALMPAGLPTHAFAQSIALVTDVSGRVTGTPPVTILSEIPADTRLQLDAGSRLVAIYLKSGDEYTFAGPAQVQFQAAEPRIISGAKPQKKASPLGKGGNVTIRPVNVAQAAFVMRGSRPTARIKLLTLSGTRTLDTVLEFRWQELEAGVAYRFELTDDTGKSLHEATVTGSGFRLPSSVQLRDGVGYTWEVSARARDGRRFVSAGDFSIAAPEVRAQAQALRPAAGAPVSERVAYAAWLVQAQLQDEARQYWRALSAERPQDERLKALAAE
jgi:hypothetical protein